MGVGGEVELSESSEGEEAVGEGGGVLEGGGVDGEVEERAHAGGEGEEGGRVLLVDREGGKVLRPGLEALVQLLRSLGQGEDDVQLSSDEGVSFVTEGVLGNQAQRGEVGFDLDVVKGGGRMEEGKGKKGEKKDLSVLNAAQLNAGHD